MKRVCSSKLIFVVIMATVIPVISQTYFTRVTDTGDLNLVGGGSWASSWGDVNNDGYMDLLVIKSPTLSLLINDGDGTFTSLNSGHLVETDFYQNSAVFGDYDNDGYLDLYISNLGPNTPIQPGQPLFPQVNFLYKNVGSPDYALELVSANGIDTDSNMTWTSSWVDYDNDGDIDMFVPGDQGDKDIFFENKGDGKFVENDDLIFLDPGEFSAAGSWTDFDNDGDQDLLIVNYQGVNNELYKNNLIENDTVSFSKITSQPIVLDQDYDLAPSFGDYDNDGDMDVFIGTWIGNKNLLFKNNGDFIFQKIIKDPIVENSWTLAYTWLDFDNDGYLDAFVANSQGENNALYRNNGNGTFTKTSLGQAGDIVQSWGSTSGVSTADYDNDGDLDIYVPGSQPSLFRNNIGADNNWIIVTCEGIKSNKSGIGAKIRVKAKINNETAVWQLREIHGGATGDRAQNSQRAHFGLGSAEKIDSLLIEWPSAIQDLYVDVSVNQFFKAIEGETPTHLEVGEKSVHRFNLYQNYPNPFNPITNIQYHLKADSFVELKVVDILGKEIATLVSEYQQKGQHNIKFTGDGFAAGVYFYKIKAGDFVKTKKMVLVK
jgi:enediyne biosynthesis protein E4